MVHISRVVSQTAERVSGRAHSDCEEAATPIDGSADLGWRVVHILDKFPFKF